MLVVFGDSVLLFDLLFDVGIEEHGVESLVVLVHGDEPAVGLPVVVDVGLHGVGILVA